MTQYLRALPIARTLLAAGALALAPVAAQAVATDALIEGAKQCTRHLPRYERQYGIPVHLLSAIASTESGRYHKGLKISVPWPWTINAEGKGYFFDSKEEAIAAAKRLRASGVKSMDVGCMQVNLLHHANAFPSIEQAFEPESNIAYAASFLRRLYDEQRNWKQAASSYHSRTPFYGNQYVSKVYDSWYNIINRVRDAKQLASAAGTSLAAATGTQGLASAAQLASASASAAFAAAGPAADRPVKAEAPAAVRKAAAPQPAYRAPSMKIIQVKSAASAQKAQEPLVIHPEAALAPITAPQAPAAAPKTLQVADASKAAAPALLKPMAAEAVAYPQDRGDVVTVHRAGPRFIFNQ